MTWENAALVLAGMVAPVLIQLFRLALEKGGINLRGVGALAIAIVTSVALAIAVLQMTGGFVGVDDVFAALAKVLMVAEFVYNVFKDKMSDWLPSKLEG